MVRGAATPGEGSAAARRPLSHLWHAPSWLHRHPAVIQLKTGMAADGTLVAAKADIYFSGGAYGSQKANPQVTVLGGRRLASMYRCPAIDVQTFCAYTNQVPCTQTRTPGSPQVVFAFESQMDIIAKEMSIDPLELRRKNILHDGDANPMGDKWDHILMSEVMEDAITCPPAFARRFSSAR